MTVAQSHKRRHLRAIIAQRDGTLCHWCGCPLWLPGCPQIGTWPATLDHIKPRSLGGKTETANLVLSCQPCNQRRGHHGSYPIAELGA